MNAPLAPIAVRAADGLPPPRRYVAIFALSLGTILTTLDSSMITVALPTIARDLRVGAGDIVIVITAYQLVMMMTLLPYAAIGDRLGRRATYQAGQIVFVVATCMCFFARSLPALVAVRSCQALGAAAVLGIGPALIRSIYPKTTLGRGLSFNTAIAAGFGSLAPTLGGLLLGVVHWPWLFATMVPFGVVSLLVGRSALPDEAARHGTIDVAGAVLCAATFGLVVVGLAMIGLGSAGGGGIRALLPAMAVVVLGIGVGTVFIRRELRQARPVLPVDLLRTGAIALPTLGMLLAWIASMMILVTLPFRLQQQYGFSPALAGAALAPWPIVVMFVAPGSAILSDRVPAGVLGGVGMAIATLALVSLGLMPAHPTHLDVAWRTALCGLGFGMYYAPNSRQVLGSAPIERAAAAGALTGTTRGLGQSLGATACAALLANGLGHGAAPMLAGAVLTVIGGLCSLGTLAQRRGRRTRAAG